MKHQWMPLFWGDFLANTLHLSAQEIGAYFLLIAHAWEHNAEIEVKDAQRIARVNNRNWAKVRAKLAVFFDPPDGLEGSALRVVSSRTATELAIAGEMSNKRKAAAVQMHANRRARAQLVHTHHTTPTSKESFLGKEANGNGVQMHRRPEPTPAWHPRVDEAEDYRSPPAKKSDNPLQPIPDKPERRQ